MKNGIYEEIVNKLAKNRKEFLYSLMKTKLKDINSKFPKSMSGFGKARYKSKP